MVTGYPGPLRIYWVSPVKLSDSDGSDHNPGASDWSHSRPLIGQAVYIKSSDWLNTQPRTRGGGWVITLRGEVSLKSIVSAFCTLNKNFMSATFIVV